MNQQSSLRDLMPKNWTELAEQYDCPPPIPSDAFDLELQRQQHNSQSRLALMIKKENERLQIQEELAEMPALPTEAVKEVKKTSYEVFQEMEDKDFYIGV